MAEESAPFSCPSTLQYKFGCIIAGSKPMGFCFSRSTGMLQPRQFPHQPRILKIGCLISQQKYILINCLGWQQCFQIPCPRAQGLGPSVDPSNNNDSLYYTGLSLEESGVLKQTFTLLPSQRGRRKNTRDIRRNQNPKSLAKSFYLWSPMVYNFYTKYGYLKEYTLLYIII